MKLRTLILITIYPKKCYCLVLLYMVLILLNAPGVLLFIKGGEGHYLEPKRVVNQSLPNTSSK